MTAAITAVALPPLLLLMGTLIELVFGAKYLGATDAARLVLVAASIQLVLGWTKSFPVSIGRPESPPDHPRRRNGRADSARRPLRTRSGGRPARRSRSSSRPASSPPPGRSSTRVSAATLSRSRRRERRSHREGADRVGDLAAGRRRPGEPRACAGRVPARARARCRRSSRLRPREPAPQPFPVTWVSRSLPRGVRHARATALVAAAARRADVVYTTGMFGRSALGARLARRPYVVKLTGGPGLRARRARRADAATTSRRSSRQARAPRRALRACARSGGARRRARLLSERRTCASSRFAGASPAERVTVLPNPTPSVPPLAEPRRDVRRRAWR